MDLYLDFYDTNNKYIWLFYKLNVWKMENTSISFDSFDVFNSYKYIYKILWRGFKRLDANIEQASYVYSFGRCSAHWKCSFPHNAFYFNYDSGILNARAFFVVVGQYEPKKEANHFSSVRVTIVVVLFCFTNSRWFPCFVLFCLLHIIL